ncbi:Abi-alpha family protein [Ectopseudomonas chengduensis]|nr:Abi-alpha family protein [Pseudomonas chengduensis]MDH1561432.1 DUF4393 domain-containing protein [Pseudomonas chengduensis]
MDEETIKRLMPLLEKAYDDVGRGAGRELGSILEDVVKTFRLALAPIQYTAFLQDSLRGHLEKCFRKVPKENLISPARSLTLPICEQLRFHEDGVLAELYTNLLSCSMDRERVSYAHPGFINVIAQMAPDEALLLEQLSSREGKLFIRCGEQSRFPYAPLEAERRSLYTESVYDQPIESSIEPFMVKPEKLAAPELFLTYLEHLVSMGVVEYTNDHDVYNLAGVSRSGLQIETFVIRLSMYGRLFHTACMADSTFGNAYD